MKYQAKRLSNGSWAVFSGKRYFTGTETVIENEAIEEALIRSMIFYQGQMDNAFGILETHCNKMNGIASNTNEILMTNGASVSYGDLLC